ncbi:MULTISPECIES: LCP family protein [unclassified Nocardioides]|uniref:LCP family protein n=1 Tax=unclassified Nocardioides TaxID=2615069 RepID=UPI0006FCD4F5|nr:MULTISPECIES: LCP family protein [unclassified Nocardioides]KRA37519.1 transcriptional regulator [Nocardioides sp. Root614]KRA91480.1 transcriptional regulator [Nocardioides sp. Root682]
MRSRIRQVTRTVFLGTLLGLLALVVPDSTPAPTEYTLVKLEKTAGVDVDPDVVWILAVGADTRPREDPLHSRADALQLIGMNTKTGAATAIGIPRDSWVPIQGVGSNRVNASLYFGGPQLLGRTVGKLVGIEPDYVMLATFSGLADLVTSIGGITVNNPRAFSDEHLNPKGFKKGRIKVNGMRAVVFGRIRHSLPAGDFDRSANQQRVLRGIQRRVAERATEAGFIEGGVLNVLKHLHTKGVSPAELFRIAQAVAQVDPAKITTCVLPGAIGNIGGASVVIPNTAVAKRYGNDARKDATIKHC